MVIGNNGILNQAESAVEKTAKASIKEELEMEVAGWLIEKKTGSGKTLEEVLSEKYTVKDNEDGTYEVKVTEKGAEYIFTVDEDGKVTLEGTGNEIEEPEEEEEWSEEYAVNTIYTDSKGKTATIPKGFQVSLKEEENDIEEGLVVRNASDRNEFVWIPVEEPESMYIKDGVSSGNHAGKLYASTYGNTFDSTYSAFSYTKGSGIREPDTLSNASYDQKVTELEKLDLFKVGSSTEKIETEADLMLELQTEYNNIVDSVEIYKGFYVGRYETSLSGTTVQSKRGVMPMTAEETSGNIWYGMYGKQKKLYESTTSSVQSGMIWGSQWDQVMLRIIQYEPLKDVKNSTGWGNYDSTIFEYIDTDGSTKTKSTNMIIPTGSTERNEAYNIYDLAGNLWEWTTEANATNGRFLRGGNYSYSGSSHPASCRIGNSPTVTYTGISSRIQLYIK